VSRPELPVRPAAIESSATTPASTAERFTALRRRMISDERLPRPWASALDGAPIWVSGLLSGLQAAVLSLLVVVLPALAAYVATSADPTLSDVGWWRSISVGIGLWLLGQGTHLVTHAAVITITPLGLTALALFTCYASARRSARTAWSSWFAGIGSYAALATLLSLTQSVAPLAAVRAALGAAVVAALGLGAGIAARADAPSLPELTRRWWRRLPAPVRSGAAAGVVAVGLVIACASLVAVGWIINGRAAIGAIVAGLGLDAIGGIALGLAQLAILPNLVVWIAAGLAGPGFVVGQGSQYSPTEVVGAPLPALPIMGALPSRVDVASAPELVPLLIVLIGAVAGWYLTRRIIRNTWRTPLLAALAGTATTWLGAFVLLACASGSAGPGRLAVVGAQLGVVPLLIAAEVGLGLVLVVAPCSPEFRAAVRRSWRRLLSRGRHPSHGVEDVDGRLTPVS
jgi:hypothetical protein